MVPGGGPQRGRTDGDSRSQRSDHRGHPAAGAAGRRDASALDARGPAHVRRRPRSAHRVRSRAVDAGDPALEHRVLRPFGQGLERVARRDRARSRDRARHRDDRRVRPVLGEGPLGARRLLAALGHDRRGRGRDRPPGRHPAERRVQRRACCTTSAPRSCSAARPAATTRCSTCSPATPSSRSSTPSAWSSA